MRPVIWLLVVACAVEDPDGSGIAVGNPPKTALARVTVADGDDVVMTSLSLPVDAVYLEDCDGEAELLEQPAGTVLELSGTGVPLPAGEYCGLGLVPAEEPVVLEGDAGPGRFRFEGRLGRILLFSPESIAIRADVAFVLELAQPGWIDAEDFGLEGGQQLDLGGPDCLDDPLCSQIQSGLTQRAGLYRDGDGDGRVGEAERGRGADASGNGRR